MGESPGNSEPIGDRRSFKVVGVDLPSAEAQAQAKADGTEPKPLWPDPGDDGLANTGDSKASSLCLDVPVHSKMLQVRQQAAMLLGFTDWESFDAFKVMEGDTPEFSPLADDEPLFGRKRLRCMGMPEPLPQAALNA